MHLLFHVAAQIINDLLRNVGHDQLLRKGQHPGDDIADSHGNQDMRDLREIDRKFRNGVSQLHLHIAAHYALIDFSRRLP